MLPPVPRVYLFIYHVYRTLISTDGSTVSFLSLSIRIRYADTRMIYYCLTISVYQIDT